MQHRLLYAHTSVRIDTLHHELELNQYFFDFDSTFLSCW